jgi:hypothetical protein
MKTLYVVNRLVATMRTIGLSAVLVASGSTMAPASPHSVELSGRIDEVDVRHLGTKNMEKAVKCWESGGNFYLRGSAQCIHSVV